MKKLFMTVTTLVLLSTASFADQNTENANKMAEMRMQFMKMTTEMVDGQMEMMKMHQAMLSNYQKLLKQMMENEQGEDSK